MPGPPPQSLLAKAFRGELVAQDKNDEPASVLLERIRSEKQMPFKSKKKAKEYELLEELSLAAEAKANYAKSGNMVTKK